jgi:hypothetical protein
MKRHGRPEVIITDGLRAYSAAMKDIGNLKRREVGRWGNNRAENSQQRFRRRERAMLSSARRRPLATKPNRAFLPLSFFMLPPGRARVATANDVRRYAIRIDWCITASLQ